MRKQGSKRAQESLGCWLLHLPSLPTAFWFGRDSIFLLPLRGNTCLSGRRLAPLNNSWWGIRLSVKVQLVYLVVSHKDKRATQDFLSCAALADALNKQRPRQTLSPPHGLQSRGGCARVVQGRDSQGEPCPPCHPWALLPWGKKELVITGGCKGPFCTYLPCSPQCSLESTIVPVQPGCRTWVPRAEAVEDIFLLEGRVHQNKRLLGAMHLLN